MSIRKARIFTLPRGLRPTLCIFAPMEPIRNKVKESGLLPMDLGELLPEVQLREIDLSAQLWQGLVLKEKDFRAWVNTEDWSAYQDALVRIHCATDAIIPTWAYMLVALRWNPLLPLSWQVPPKKWNITASISHSLLWIRRHFKTNAL